MLIRINSTTYHKISGVVPITMSILIDIGIRVIVVEELEVVPVPIVLSSQRCPSPQISYRSSLIGYCHLSVVCSNIAEEQGTQHEPVPLGNSVPLITLEQILHKHSKWFGVIRELEVTTTSGCSEWISTSSFAAC